MKKLKYLGSFFIAFVFGVFVMSNIGSGIANDISNIDKKKQPEYFTDEHGNVWSSKDEYLKYEENEYYVAPDGTYWKNEYRYQESLK